MVTGDIKLESNEYCKIYLSASGTTFRVESI